MSQQASATGFLPQDPRALGMGGTGVAVGNSRQAHYYNPSLLVNAREDEDFNFEIDLAIRYSDSDKLFQSAKDFADDDPFTKLGESIDALDLNDPTTFEAVSVASKNLRQSMQDVTGKSLTIDGNIGTFVSAPNLKYSWALYFNAWTNIGLTGIIGESDLDTMNGFIAITDGTFDQNTLTQLTQDNPTLAGNLDSSIQIKGAGVREIGIAIANKQTISNYDLDIGITPKIQMVTTFGTLQSLQETEEETDPFDFKNTETTTSFNIDIGISKELNEHWTTGLMIKNLIPYTYDVKEPAGTPANIKFDDVKISPSFRIGAGWRNDWISAGVDLDILKNEDIASETETQFLTVGGEFDVWLLQLRAGYRHNFAGDGGSGPSVGLGLYLLGLNVDVAAATNTLSPSDITEVDNANVAAQIGFNW